MAMTPALTRQPAGAYHLALGDTVVTAINDGMFEASLDILVNIETDRAAALQRAHFRADPPRLTVNAFLVRSRGAEGERLTLIDTGTAAAMGPGLGFLVENLEACGVTPDMIGTVLLTHLHPDHAQGLIDAEGRAVFANAELVFPEGEAGFWLNDAVMAQAPAEARGYFEGARRAVAPYAARTRRIASGEVLPGITAMPLPGHTPGHTGYMVEGGGDRVLIWADIVHMPGVQFAYPAAGISFDADPAAARATRERILDVAATDRLRVAGSHHDFPAFGHVARASEGYAFVPEVWTPAPGGLRTP